MFWFFSFFIFHFELSLTYAKTFQKWKMKNEKCQSLNLSKINHWICQKPAFENQSFISWRPFFIFEKMSIIDFSILDFSFFIPDLDQIGTRPGPDPEQIWSRRGPDLVPIWTRSGPDLDQIWTRSGPDWNQIGSRSGPDLDQIGTRSGPEPDQIWTRSGPDLDQI